MRFYINETKNLLLFRLLNDCFKFNIDLDIFVLSCSIRITWHIYNNLHVYCSFQLSIPDNDTFIIAKYSAIESCHEVVFGNKLILETNT